MNRILTIIRDARGKRALAENPAPLDGGSPMELRTDVATCAFCGEAIAGSPYTAYSMPSVAPRTAICARCIEGNAIYARFARRFALWYESPPGYPLLREYLLRRLTIEKGSEELKETAADIGIRFLQRSSAALAGVPFERCPKTGVSLMLPRIAVICQESKTLSDLLRVVCSEIGIAYRLAASSQVASGIAYQRLRHYPASDNDGWAAHGMICCVGYAPPDQTFSGLVYVAQRITDIPSGIERIIIGGAKK